MYNGDPSVHVYAPGILEIHPSYTKNRIRHELSCMIGVKGFHWEIYANAPCTSPYRAWDSLQPASRGMWVGERRKCDSSYGSVV